MLPRLAATLDLGRCAACRHDPVGTLAIRLLEDKIESELLADDTGEETVNRMLLPSGYFHDRRDHGALAGALSGRADRSRSPYGPWSSISSGIIQITIGQFSRLSEPLSRIGRYQVGGLVVRGIARVFLVVSVVLTAPLRICAASAADLPPMPTKTPVAVT